MGLYIHKLTTYLYLSTGGFQNKAPQQSWKKAHVSSVAGKFRRGQGARVLQESDEPPEPVKISKRQQACLDEEERLRRWEEREQEESRLTTRASRRKADKKTPGKFRRGEGGRAEPAAGAGAEPEPEPE